MSPYYPPFAFDLAGRLTDLTHQQNATVFADYDWDYDAGNRLEQFVSSVDGTVDYNYDARDQLTDADYTGAGLPADESYTYDDNGNRVLANGATYQTDPNNRLVNDGTYTYLYDDEGNLTQRTKTSDGSYTVYAWDHRNRLTQITDKTSLNVVTKEVTYQYDVFDRRIAKAIDTPASGLQSQVYIYDGAHIAMTLSYNAVSEEYELTNRYLHGPAVDMILADEQISDPAQAGNTLWPLTDNLGSVRDVADYDAATDATTIANHLVYDSFGNIASETNAAIDHIFGYTGRERDEESDFYFYRGRYYDPKTGRFASEDPIGFGAGDPNLNRYVGNNATGAGDPSGMVTGPLAGGSNVVDANGNPTGNVDSSDEFYLLGDSREDFLSDWDGDPPANSGYPWLDGTCAFFDEVAHQVHSLSVIAMTAFDSDVGRRRGERLLTKSINNGVSNPSEGRLAWEFSKDYVVPIDLAADAFVGFDRVENRFIEGDELIQRRAAGVSGLAGSVAVGTSLIGRGIPSLGGRSGRTVRQLSIEMIYITAYRSDMETHFLPPSSLLLMADRLL